MSYRLQKNILCASVSENYPDAIQEWILESDKIPNEKGFCVCGRKIKNIYYGRNVRNKNMIMLGTKCVKEIQESNGNFTFGANTIIQLFKKGFYNDLNIPDYCRQVFHEYLISINLDIQALHHLWQDYPLYRDIITNKMQQKIYLLSIVELEALPTLIKQTHTDVINKRIGELICKISTLEELEALPPLIKQTHTDVINKQKKAFHEKSLMEMTKNIQNALYKFKPICQKCNIAKMRYRLSNTQFHLDILNVICSHCRPIYEKLLSRYQKKDTKNVPIR